VRRGDISLPTEIIAVTVAAAAAAVVGALRCLLLTAAASTPLTGGSRMLPGKSWVEAKKKIAHTRLPPSVGFRS